MKLKGQTTTNGVGVRLWHHMSLPRSGRRRRALAGGARAAQHGLNNTEKAVSVDAMQAVTVSPPMADYRLLFGYLLH